MNPIEQALQTQVNLTKAKPQLLSLKHSCEGMESAFLKQMVGQMRKSAGSVRFGKEFGGEMYRDMFDGSIADLLAQKGTMGVAKAMFASVAPRVLNQAVERNRTTEGTKN